MSGIEELYAIVNQVAEEQEATQKPNSQSIPAQNGNNSFWPWSVVIWDGHNYFGSTRIQMGHLLLFPLQKRPMCMTLWRVL